MNFFKDEWDDFEKNCGFTDDELEVARYLRRGWRAIDIAAELYVSEKTIIRRKKKIKQKILRYIEKSNTATK